MSFLVYLSWSCVNCRYLLQNVWCHEKSVPTRKACIIHSDSYLCHSICCSQCNLFALSGGSSNNLATTICRMLCSADLVWCFHGFRSYFSVPTLRTCTHDFNFQKHVMLMASVIESQFRLLWVKLGNALLHLQRKVSLVGGSVSS